MADVGAADDDMQKKEASSDSPNVCLSIETENNIDQRSSLINKELESEITEKAHVHGDEPFLKRRETSQTSTVKHSSELKSSDGTKRTDSYDCFCLLMCQSKVK